MEILTYFLPCYLLGTFLLSAATVRHAPRAYSSRQIRRHFRLFPALPVLLIFDLVWAIGAASRHVLHLLRTAFEFLSGRQLLDGELRTYTYFGQGSPPQKRRKRRDRSQRPDVAAARL